MKRYKKADKNAVDDISFEVEEGEFFTLLGPNGAGKTTTISILTTTLSKTSGQVMIAGYDLDENQSKVRQNVGIIFQNQSLDKNLTAEENIRFHAVLYGLYPFRPTFSLMPKKYRDEVYKLAEIIGIKDDLNKPIKSFSGGMKRKLEIIRSLIHHPKVLFLDEPTTGLDPLSRKNLWEYLTDVRKNEKTTIFLTTHYLDEAEEADHICIINQGKILQMGTPKQIKQSLVEDYLVLDSKNRDKLAMELQKLKLNFTGSEKFKISLKGTTAQKVIQKIKTDLSTIVVHAPSLEDAYLEIIGNKSQGEL